MSILEKISDGGDIKQLNIKQLTSLAEEIREKIINGAYLNGGHLASNLGVIELTVALHYVFDFSKDKIIFDVGHQCYAHKILSGRLSKFNSIRTENGISGFPNVEESEYDAYSSGHAGTAIGAGLGYCLARDRLGDSYEVVSVVGDASFLNGVSSESLMTADKKPNDFIVILNDNGMAISKNTSGMYKALSKMTTKSLYEKFKRGVQRVFGKSFVTKFLTAIRNFVKKVLGGNTYLDNLGLKYVGVIDGHDMKELVKTLRIIKNSHQPVLLHVNTKKGKGYKDAEESAERYHGVGKRFVQNENDFSAALGETLSELADKDKKIHAITAAMTDGTGLSSFSEKHPENFTDVGISEEYAVTLAAGMALGGLKPVVCIYSTFLQRAYDQILEDVCLQNLGVTFCLDRAGVVGSDGQTHQGIFDLSYLSHMPNMTIFVPKDVAEMKKMLAVAVDKGSPVAIRYPNGKNFSFDEDDTPIEKWQVVKNGGNIVILAVGGRMLDIALRAADLCGKDITVINARTVKPLDYEVLDKIKNSRVITMEDNVETGGFGSAVAGYFANNSCDAKLKIMAIKKGVIKQAGVERQLELNGLSVESLIGVINNYD